MTELLAAPALAVSDSFVLSLTLKATVILIVALACAHGVPRARASRRFLVVAWALVVVGSLPAVALLGRPLTVVVRDAPSALPLPMPASPIRAVMPDGSPPLADARDGPLESVLSSQPERGPTWTELVAIGWAVGFLVSVLPIAGALLRLRRLRRAAGASIDIEECRERWPDLVEKMGLSRWPEVRLLDAALVPITFGMRRPVILLPADICTWRSDDVRRAVIHELEHVRRRDWPVHVLARFICSIFWFHPLVWVAWRTLHVLADRSCDDAVADAGEGEEFAEQLLALAGRMNSKPATCALSIAGRGDLSTRVMALLRPHQHRGPAGRTWAAMAGVVALTSGALVAALHASEGVRAPSGGADRSLQREASNTTPIPNASSVEPLMRQLRLPERMVFEVATIRLAGIGAASLPSPSPTLLSSGIGIPSPSSDAFVTNSASVAELVRWAYGMHPEFPELFAAPARPWSALDLSPVASSEAMAARFDIRGKAPVQTPEPPRGTLGPFHYMLQALLEERFKLAVRWELRERPQYVLSFAGLVNPESPLLRPRFDCGEAVGPPADGVPRTAGSAAERRCGPVRVTLTPTGGHLSGAGIAMARLVEMLQRVVRAEVIDGTGFTERFDLDLQFGEPPHASTLEAALRESLGLRLDRREVPGEVLVVEHVEMPVLD